MKWICVAVVQVAVLISSESGIYHRGGWYLVIEVVVVEGNTVIIVVMVAECCMTDFMTGVATGVPQSAESARAGGAPRQRASPPTGRAERGPLGGAEGPRATQG